ncbi:MAG: hypothetical protein ACFFFB_01435 [Candidatus Heimdallarchaeota archaeon]
MEATDYTEGQMKVARIFYIIIVIACLIIIGGTVWSIADFISPTGKLDAFLELNWGYKIAIIAGFLAGLFFLLVFFYGLFKKGSKWILRVFFKVRELEERFKNRITVKIAAGGLLTSIILVLIGVVWALVQEILIPESGSPFSGLFSLFSSGNWALFIGISVLVAALIILFMIYFWKNGYRLILKIMGTLEKER